MPCLSQVGGNYFYGQKRFFPNIDFLRSRIIQGFSKLLYFPFLMFIFPKGVTFHEGRNEVSLFTTESPGLSIMPWSQ